MKFNQYTKAFALLFITLPILVLSPPVRKDFKPPSIVRIEKGRSVASYYPYFYKTKVIDYNDKLNMKELTNDCTNTSCEWCEPQDKTKCLLCKHGYFLYRTDKPYNKSDCFTVCPLNYIADIFKRECHPLDHQNTLAHISYLKAFSVGSCKNLCGKTSIDCSCLPSCISEGNCCSDYHNCEALITKNTGRQGECAQLDAKCELCESFVQGKLSCGKCREGLWNREGVCVSSCASGDTLKSPNFVCLPRQSQSCIVANCSTCARDSGLCRTCMNGYFMYNNQCIATCPHRMRADRISWSCLEPPVFAWYWIFPSRSSCRDTCGKPMDSDTDCSCMADCFRRGNCCQDIEDYCPQYVDWN